MNRILINETAFKMTRILLGMIAHEADDEEHRRLFEQVFSTCTAGLTGCCQQVQQTQHTLCPMGGNDAPATTK